MGEAPDGEGEHREQELDPGEVEDGGGGGEGDPERGRGKSPEEIDEAGRGLDRRDETGCASCVSGSLWMVADMR